jgi:cation diffusion facilitator family transporter
LVAARAEKKKNPGVIKYYRKQVDLVEKQQALVEYMNQLGAHELRNAVDLPRKDHTPGAVAAAVAAVSVGEGTRPEEPYGREPVGSQTTDTASAAPSSIHNDDDDTSVWVKIAIRGSLALNVCLLVLKLIAYIQSGSLTVLASFVDSTLDLFSGLILVVTQALVSRGDPLNYPIGKHNFEPIGVLVFSCCMCVAASQILQEAVIAMVDIGSLGLYIDLFTLCAIGAVIFTKFMMHLYCRYWSSESESCDALAADHRNDVVTNSLGLGALFVALYAWKYADPLVAALTAVYIMVNWARSCYEQIQVLNGRRATRDDENLITFVALHHHPDIKQVDTVRCYVTGGGGVIAEVDVVMEPTASLRECHDVGESLQLLLERCPLLNVHRAYVHIDYETEHKPSDHR